MKLFRKLFMFSFAVVLIISAILINLENQLSKFQSAAKLKEASVNEYVKIMGNFISTMTVYADDYLATGHSDTSSLFDYIKNDPAANSFNMDDIRGTAYEGSNGNLTGMGKIPANDQENQEIGLALEFGKYFSSFYQQVPEVAWLRYTSEADFLYLYPWASSSEVAYSAGYKNMEYYAFVAPKSTAGGTSLLPNDSAEGNVIANNRGTMSGYARDERYKSNQTWTPVYMDVAGKGLVVTLSSPIYRGDTFEGVLSLDLTTKKLGEMISSDYRSYLTDTKNSVIAAGSNVRFDWNEIQFEKLSGLPKSDIDKVNQLGASQVRLVGNNFIYTAKIESTPWSLYFVVSVWTVLGISLLYSLPIIIISTLLVLTEFLAEKRKHTELMLTKSLTEIQSYQALLENCATHDFLTNTCNRRGLAEHFEHFMKINTQDVPVSFIIGDIDEFKIFNDTYGHSAGDKVLVELAELMKKDIDENDIVCRWGGEEFVIMLANRTYGQALLFAEKLRFKIEENTIPWEDTLGLHTTMTFGVAQYDKKYNMKSAVSEADSALYLGKKRGRNRVVGWQEVVDFPGIPPVSPELVSE